MRKYHFYFRIVCYKHITNTSQILNLQVDLVTGIDAPVIKRRMNQVISINLQQQEHEYLDRIKGLKLRVAFLESKCKTVEERAKRKSSCSIERQQKLEENLERQERTLQEKYRLKYRRINLEFHAMKHELQMMKGEGGQGCAIHANKNGKRKSMRYSRRNAVSS
jgi:hypothetical protein